MVLFSIIAMSLFVFSFKIEFLMIPLVAFLAGVNVEGQFNKISIVGGLMCSKNLQWQNEFYESEFISYAKCDSPTKIDTIQQTCICMKIW